MNTLYKSLKIPFLTFIIILSINAQEFEKFRYWEIETGLPHSYWIFENVPQNEITEIKKRWEEIGESIKNNSNPFAGTYSQSGNRGYYFRWSPEKGFVYVYYYEGFVRDASYGKVLVTDSGVKFIVEREMKNEDAARKLVTPTEWIPAFNEKQFLIQKENIKSFGDFYGGFGDFYAFPTKWECECSPFAKRIDKNIDYRKIKSFIVPPKYLKFIKQPIVGKIVSVGTSRISTISSDNEESLSSKISSTTVTINLGRKNGIKRGFVFNVDDAGDFVEVTKVGEITSQAVVIRQIDKNGMERHLERWDGATDKPIYKTYTPFGIGTKITTKVDMKIYDRY